MRVRSSTLIPASGSQRFGVRLSTLTDRDRGPAPDSSVCGWLTRNRSTI